MFLTNFDKCRTELFGKELTIYIKMDLVLHYL